MTHDNPYTPPNSEVGNPEEIARPAKRPASHKWVIFIFMLVTAVFLLLLAAVGARGVRLWGIFLGPAEIVALVGMFFRKLAKSTYFMVATTLTGFVIFWLWVFWKFGSSGFLEGGVAAEGSFMLALYIASLVFLLYRFTFGRASRAYYGFAVSPEKK